MKAKSVAVIAFALVAGLLGSCAPAVSHAQGLTDLVASPQQRARARDAQNANDYAVSGNSIGGGFGKQARAALKQQQTGAVDPALNGDPQSFRFDSKGKQGKSEYRGYNGRTLEQAYYKCKYDAWRTAPPGERSKGLFEKVRMRAFSMEGCMSSEGFFRQTRSARFDTEFLTGTDIMDSIFAK
jgi:hypothetical protein